MSARCSSCHYPLSICDSVACHECHSYFHLDCARLVGFPLFGLGAETFKNTFHCNTCQLLPLVEVWDDSDSSDDEAMPSRQSEPTETDVLADMNEVKGSIQDISNLCKDMLREINDLKSINLTLRCCVENLRHENGQRDEAITKLNLRIERLEAKLFGQTDSKHHNLQENVSFTRISENYIDEDVTCKVMNKETLIYPKSIMKETSSIREGTSFLSKSEEEENNEDSVTDYGSQQLLITDKEEKIDAYLENSQDKQDRSWSEYDTFDQDDESEGEESEVESETENSQSFSKPKEEDKSVVKENEQVTELELSVKEGLEENEDETEDMSKTRKSVTWDENICEDESETENEKELNEDSELGSEQNGEGANEFKVESNAAESIITEGCETEDIVVAEENEIRLDTDESPLEGDSGLEPTEGQPPEIFVEESEFPLEANDGNLVYEGESRLDDQEFLEEDDVRLPETPPPAHTEEDLWLYLKDHVSSVHPSTVEEFVQNLIGTLQHVPEEYLMPVIEANIKRANTPSVTDGEHLTSSPDGVRPGEENEVFKEGILENGSCASPVDAEGEDFPPASEGSLFPDDAASLQAAD